MHGPISAHHHPRPVPIPHNPIHMGETPDAAADVASVCLQSCDGDNFFMRACDARIYPLLCDFMDELEEGEAPVFPLPGLNAADIQFFIRFAHQVGQTPPMEPPETSPSTEVTPLMKFPVPIPVCEEFGDIVGSAYAAMVEGMDKPALNRLAWVRLCPQQHDAGSTGLRG